MHSKLETNYQARQPIIADPTSELFSQIDRRLTANPGQSIEVVAQELGTTGQKIERVVLEVLGVSFREYRENKRLDQALKRVIQEASTQDPAATQIFNQIRESPRYVVPGATVRYLVRNSGTGSGAFSDASPLINLTLGGLALFTDHSLKVGKRLQLSLSFGPNEPELLLKGGVIYARINTQTTYRYRVGVKFAKFESKEGCNPPEALGVLERLRQRFAE